MPTFVDISAYETLIRDCFVKDGIQRLWYSGTPKMVGQDWAPNAILIAINENLDWKTYDRNCYCLQDDFFDYNKLKGTGIEIDCETDGVFVFFKHQKKEVE